MLNIKQLLDSEIWTSDFKSYINAIDTDCDDEYVTFTGYVHKLNTPQFKFVEQSAYSKGFNYREKFFEYHVQIVFIPNSGMCFVNFVNRIPHFTRRNTTEEFLVFIRKEKYWSGVITSAKTQPYCRNFDINNGCFDGKRISSRKITEKNTSLIRYKIISV